MLRLHLLLSGDVQGVGYRWFARAQARQLALVGWVGNLWDGRVEVVAEGERAQLDAFLAQCRQGPPFGHVESVEVAWLSATGEFKEFRITSE